MPPTASKPSPSSTGRDMAPAWTVSAGVPRATASSQRAATSARYAPRPRAFGSTPPPRRLTTVGVNTVDATPAGSPSTNARYVRVTAPGRDSTVFTPTVVNLLEIGRAHV